MAGQMTYPHMGQNQKTAVVGYKPKASRPLLRVPANEAIPRFDFPGRAAKKHARQVTLITIANEVAQVLARGAAKAQIMMLS